MSKSLSRRGFIERASALGAVGVAAPALVPGRAIGEAGRPGANEKIGVALIGCGGMGRANLGACAGQPDVVVLAACDPWKSRRDAVVAQSKDTCKPYHDYREVLEQKETFRRCSGSIRT